MPILCLLSAANWKHTYYSSVDDLSHTITAPLYLVWHWHYSTLQYKSVFVFMFYVYWPNKFTCHNLSSNLVVNGLSLVPFSCFGCEPVRKMRYLFRCGRQLLKSYSAVTLYMTVTLLTLSHIQKIKYNGPLLWWTMQIWKLCIENFKNLQKFPEMQ